MGWVWESHLHPLELLPPVRIELIDLLYRCVPLGKAQALLWQALCT